MLYRIPWPIISTQYGKNYKDPPPVGLRLKQYQIGTGGYITPPEKTHLLSSIDTSECSKWELKEIDLGDGSSLKMWCDVLDVTWVCFGCNSKTFKHAPFCHNSQSYSKRESDRNDSSTLNVFVSNFLECNDIVQLFHDEQNYFKNKLTKSNSYEEQLKRHDTENVACKVSEDQIEDDANDCTIDCAITAKAAEDLCFCKTQIPKCLMSQPMICRMWEIYLLDIYWEFRM